MCGLESGVMVGGVLGWSGRRRVNVRKGTLSRTGCFCALHRLNDMRGGEGDRVLGAEGGFGAEFVLLGEG